MFSEVWLQLQPVCASPYWGVCALFPACSERMFRVVCALLRSHVSVCECVYVWVCILFSLCALEKQVHLTYSMQYLRQPLPLNRHQHTSYLDFPGNPLSLSVPFKTKGDLKKPSLSPAHVRSEEHTSELQSR